MSKRRSGDLRRSREERFAKLPSEMKERIGEFKLSLHGVREDTRDVYIAKMEWFGSFLAEQGITQFENVDKKNIDVFLSKYSNPNTKNLFIQVFRSFYRDLKPDVVKHLRIYDVELEQITPSELLTPDEVVLLAQEVGKKREMNKYLVLVLFESCARISEVLDLRLGDVVFSSVTDKEGKRNLIATLHFRRSKGGVNKQPVVLAMFASELKRWVDNHPYKGDEQAYLFPSPILEGVPVAIETIGTALWNAGQRLGIKKRLHPHWFRHSGLSYFADSKNYSEQLLMWRAGWTNTSMARRYIHSGAELEGKAYLERMGYQVEGKDKEEKKILPKTCPHCNALNPYTNQSCDLCAMPLDLEQYKAEIDKRRNIEQLYRNLQQFSDKTLSEEQEMELNKRTDTVLALLELGRDDLAREYISKLLEQWTKMFLIA